MFFFSSLIPQAAEKMCLYKSKKSVSLQMKQELLLETFATKTQNKLLRCGCVALPLMNVQTAGFLFPNVYSYSTLTTNSASASNFNHDVNLFPVTAYWLPSLIPSSIIFFRDCFLFFCWWWWCDFSRQSNLGKHVGALTSGGAHCAARCHLLNHYFPLKRSRMQFFLFCFVVVF